jgi:hypothetical protein
MQGCTRMPLMSARCHASDEVRVRSTVIVDLLP